MTKPRAIVMKPNDNVSTVVETIAAGTNVTVNTGNTELTVQVIENIPFAHKFALTNIAAGTEIRKYGEVIGIATSNIKAGQYVHVHNLESCRGRGDKSG